MQHLSTLFLVGLLISFGFGQSTIPYESIRGPLCAVHVEGEATSRPLSPLFSQYNVVITDGHAHIQLTQVFTNTIGSLKDLVYLFPLPNEAAVHAMAMEYRDSVFRAEIMERAQAQAKYDSAVQQGSSAALLVQERPNLFQQRIANIGFGDTAYIRVQLSMPLKYVQGEYEFRLPTMVAPRFQSAAKVTSNSQNPSNWNPPPNREGHSLQVNVILQTGFPISDIVSPTHPILTSDFESQKETLSQRGLLQESTVLAQRFSQVLMLRTAETYPNRDYVLRFKRSAATQDFSMASYWDSQKNLGHFSLVLFPQLESATGERPDWELVILIDVSGSQNGWPLEKQKQVALEMLNRVRPSDRINVLSFSQTISYAFGENRTVVAHSENVTRARDFIQGLTAGGGTNLLAGIQAALANPIENDMQRYYVFLTDGFITNEDAIFQAIQNHPFPPTLLTFGAGNNLNHHFLDQAAKIGNGFSTPILNSESAIEKVNQAWATLEKSQLKNLSLNLSNALPLEVVEPASKSLWAGRPYSVYGKYLRGGDHLVTITGYQEGKKVTLQREVTFSAEENVAEAIPKLWARKTIERLRREEGTGDSHRDSILQISVDYQVLSKYTAFLAIRGEPTVENGGISDDVNRSAPIRTLFREQEIGFHWRHLPDRLELITDPDEGIHSVVLMDARGRILTRWRGEEHRDRFIWKTEQARHMLRKGVYFFHVVTSKQVLTYRFTWNGFQLLP